MQSEKVYFKVTNHSSLIITLRAETLARPKKTFEFSLHSLLIQRIGKNFTRENT